MPIGKRLRFEIFKRDGFTCQYCGRRPPEVVLELDHIDPRATGGTDDEINLITACGDCNRGKSDKRLGDIHPRPDADIKYLETQQEIAEAQRYLDAAKKRDRLKGQIISRLQQMWNDNVDPDYGPSVAQWNTWLSVYSPEEIEFSIGRMAGKYRAGRFGHGTSGVREAVRYASGILKARAAESVQTGRVN